MKDQHIVIYFVIFIIVFGAGYFIGVQDTRSEALSHWAANYNPTNGQFQWNDKPKILSISNVITNN